MTPLHITSQKGHNSSVEILIQAGADVKAVNKVSCFYENELITFIILFCINI